MKTFLNKWIEWILWGVSLVFTLALICYLNHQPLPIWGWAALAAFGGHSVIRPIIALFQWKIYSEWEDEWKHTEIAGFIGLVERTLYFVAILSHQVEFVAVWLVFKTAVHWKAWTEGEGDKSIARATFNLYVLGTGLSLLAVVVVLVWFLGWNHTVFHQLQ